ncbi:hypothetical protein [Streptomyces sp. NPDC048057]|uniref:hypothetical protein n=1 Tax=Streptomyces sp. NPDC048057 TaxID=3155628 RepID=UPI003402BA64
MLTATSAVRPELRTGFLCEAVAYCPHANRKFPLGSHAAATPRLALRWLHARAGDIIDQLDPPAAAVAHDWLADRAEHEWALELLAEGEPYDHIVREGKLRYLLSVLPAGSTRFFRQTP